jgi:hypothetical protein
MFSMVTAAGRKEYHKSTQGFSQPEGVDYPKGRIVLLCAMPVLRTGVKLKRRPIEWLAEDAVGVE